MVLYNLHCAVVDSDDVFCGFVKRDIDNEKIPILDAKKYFRKELQKKAKKLGLRLYGQLFAEKRGPD